MFCNVLQTFPPNTLHLHHLFIFILILNAFPLQSRHVVPHCLMISYDFQTLWVKPLIKHQNWPGNRRWMRPCSWHVLSCTTRIGRHKKLNVLINRRIISLRKNSAGSSRLLSFHQFWVWYGVIWCDMRRHGTWCRAWIQARSIWTCRGHLHDQLSIFGEDCWSVIHIVGAGVGHILVRNPWFRELQERHLQTCSFSFQWNRDDFVLPKKLHYIKFFLGIT